MLIPLRDSIPGLETGVSMRGGEVRSGSLFSYVDLEARVPRSHPLRAIRAIVDAALARLNEDFEAIYAPIGRPSIPPEQLLRGLLLQAFYTVRSERQLMEQLDYNLLFRWFVGLGIDDPVWDVTVFTKNRDRLLDGEIAAKFFAAVLDDARVKGLLSDEHFSVDGTLIQAWAGLKSFRPKDGSGAPPSPGRNGECDFHGEKRSNETHRSTSDDDARLFRKGDGQTSRLCFIGHVLMENRNGLAVDAELTGFGHGRTAGGAGHGRGAAGRTQDARRRQGLRRPGFRHGTARARHHPACGAERLREGDGPPPLGNRRADDAP
jgi:transposase